MIGIGTTARVGKFNLLITAEYILRGKGSNNITDCCKGKQKTAYGFIWKYKK